MLGVIFHCFDMTFGRAPSPRPIRLCTNAIASAHLHLCYELLVVESVFDSLGDLKLRRPSLFDSITQNHSGTFETLPEAFQTVVVSLTHNALSGTPT